MAHTKRIMCAFALLTALGLTFASAQDEKPAGATVNFQGQGDSMTLGDIIALYSESTGEVVLHDPKKFTGTISVTAPQAGVDVDVEELLNSALAEYRLVMATDGSFKKIIPAAEACTICETVTIEELDSLPPTRFARIVVSIRNIDANAARGALQNLTTRQGGLVSPVALHHQREDSSGTNALLIADYVHNLRQLVQMLDELEAIAAVDSEIIRLEHSNSRSVANALFASSKNVKFAFSDNPKVLVLTGTKPEISRVKQLIAELDTPSDD